MLANTDGRGNVKPSDFDKALFNVITEKLEEYPFEINRWQNRENTGLVGNAVENISDLLREKMNHYMTSKVLTFNVDRFELPTDLRYIDSVYFESALIEPCKNAFEFRHLQNFKYAQPTEQFPIGFVIDKKLLVVPATIDENVTLYYLRLPKVPKWTYQIISGVEVFNPSNPDFQDIDIHPSEEQDIVARLCVKFGLNLKEQDLQVAGRTDQAEAFNKQNTP